MEPRPTSRALRRAQARARVVRVKALLFALGMLAIAPAPAVAPAASSRPDLAALQALGPGAANRRAHDVQVEAAAPRAVPQREQIRRAVNVAVQHPQRAHRSCPSNCFTSSPSITAPAR